MKEENKMVQGQEEQDTEEEMEAEETAPEYGKQ